MRAFCTGNLILEFIDFDKKNPDIVYFRQQDISHKKRKFPSNSIKFLKEGQDKTRQDKKGKSRQNYFFVLDIAFRTKSKSLRYIICQFYS